MLPLRELVFLIQAPTVVMVNAIWVVVARFFYTICTANQINLGQQVTPCFVYRENYQEGCESGGDGL